MIASVLQQLVDWPVSSSIPWVSKVPIGKLSMYVLDQRMELIFRQRLKGCKGRHRLTRACFSRDILYFYSYACMNLFGILANLSYVAKEVLR